MNSVVIIGRLGADPEIKKTGSGLSVANFTVAVDRKGAKTEERITDWLDIVAWRNTADFVCKYFRKGSPIAITGNIQTRIWEDKDGKKRKTVEIIAESVEFVPKAKEEGGSFASGNEDSFEIVEGEDLPF